MAKKQKRDNAYYKERLERDYPAIYADLKAGKHGTVADAAIAAGLKKVRTRLHELKNAWTKANATEQNDFLRWLAGAGVVLPSIPSHVAAALSFTVAVDRRLAPAAIRRIEEIMLKRHLKPGDLMAELGYSRLNASVGMALTRGTQLKPDVILALEKWLVANSSV
ncbi:hypothetical protein [Rhizobium sp. SYY.PMSO]|uniref:hypothetical protein n=1 Tax=Rhizobium sp. SYY.PMSO TaxID=3382192 RepID=UPI00398FC9E8